LEKHLNNADASLRSALRSSPRASGLDATDNLFDSLHEVHFEHEINANGASHLTSTSKDMKAPHPLLDLGQYLRDPVAIGG
jgi:hypothetical protein